MLVVGSDALDLVLAGREARTAFESLCDDGCNRSGLTFILTAMLQRFPFFFGPTEEEKRSKSKRQADAETLKRAAKVVRENWAFLVPTRDTDAATARRLASYDAALANSGTTSPARLVRALQQHASMLLGSERLVLEMQWRPNQDFYDTAARYLLCQYVHTATTKWHDTELALLLVLVGNHKPQAGRRTPTALTGHLLAHWRRNNLRKLDNNQLLSDSFASLVRVHPPRTK